LEFLGYCLTILNLSKKNAREHRRYVGRLLDLCPNPGRENVIA